MLQCPGELSSDQMFAGELLGVAFRGISSLAEGVWHDFYTVSGLN